MDEIVQVMTHLSQFVTGHDQPVEYSHSFSEDMDLDEETIDHDTMDITWNTNSSQVNGDPEINGFSNTDQNRRKLLELKNNPGFSTVDSRDHEPQPATPSIRNKTVEQNNTFAPLHVDCDPVGRELISIFVFLIALLRQINLFGD